MTYILWWTVVHDYSTLTPIRHRIYSEDKWSTLWRYIITLPSHLYGRGDIMEIRGRKRHVCVSVPKECVSVYCTKGLYCRFIQYVRISGFVQSRRVHLFIVNCLLKHMFNIHVIYYLHI